MINQDDVKAQNRRLVFVSMTNAVGGAENVLQMLARVENSPVIFLKRVFSNVYGSGSGKEVYLTERSLVTGFLKLLKELRGLKDGDILFSTHPYLNAYLGLMKRIGFIKGPLIVRECSSIFSRYSGLKRLSYRLAYKLGYPSVDVVICQTDLMRMELLSHNSFIPPGRAVVLENPLDLNLIREKAAELLNEDDANSNFICAAGRLISIKGFDVLIRSFTSIASVDPDLKLVILGEGRERNNLNNLIKELNLEGRVVLKGHVDNPVPFFKHARVCVVSSIQEGFPNVLLEMMAVNASVVSTLCAGGIEKIPFISKVEVNSVSALSSAITQALAGEYKSDLENVDRYLKQRTPASFMNLVLSEV